MFARRYDADGQALDAAEFQVTAHLLAVTPTADWIEYVDWANPILREPLRVRDGHVQAPDRPGLGLEWDEAAVDRWAFPR